ncbi:MAG TPA: putative quinol monooxygenase [Rhizobium sp.]|nr:putative quinol monooxygenase [Rhizobium sp.]
MTNKRIYLDGHIDVPSDRREAVMAALPQHIALTRAEPGCLKFEVTVSESVAGRLDVSEVFVDQTAFDGHQTRTRASDWFKVTEGIQRHFTIRTGVSV